VWAEQCLTECTEESNTSLLLGETDRLDSGASLVGAANVDVDEERARVARKIEELADNFILKRRARPLADAREYGCLKA
jgi:hypothetical protein